MRTTLIALLFFLGGHATAVDLVVGNAGGRLQGHVVADFPDPWALSFLDDVQLLVTTQSGKLWLLTTTGDKALVQGVPTVFAGGQGGLGDVVPHPQFSNNRLVYFSYVNSTDGGKTRFATVARATLVSSNPPTLTKLETIWRQFPAHAGMGHFSHRIAFGPTHSPHAGKLFISSGDRQALSPAQSWDMNLGKIVRLNDDGSVPRDNPFQNNGALAQSFWTMGHRNVLGLAFDANGQLWSHEMGPRHGDELNIVMPGNNYGWPLVSEGRHYSGIPIPSHSTRADFKAPELYWVPTVAPSGLAFVAGSEFPQWTGHALIGGLRSQALIRIAFTNGKAYEAERFGWTQRVRDVELAADGTIWVLEDPPLGRLIRFSKPLN
jgi:glucose/arabinose dehydrogenase